MLGKVPLLQEPRRERLPHGPAALENGHLYAGGQIVIMVNAEIQTSTSRVPNAGKHTL
jgi:hypothetical protein